MRGMILADPSMPLEEVTALDFKGAPRIRRASSTKVAEYKLWRSPFWMKLDLLGSSPWDDAGNTVAQSWRRVLPGCSVNRSSLNARSEDAKPQSINSLATSASNLATFAMHLLVSNSSGLKSV